MGPLVKKYDSPVLGTGGRKGEKMSKSAERNKVENRTSNESNHDPLVQFVRMAFGGDTPIEDQEARGQKSFVNSCDLPADCRSGDDVLIAMGIKLGDPYPDDPVFRSATLPEGWKKVPTDHAMWSDLVDDKGRRRAAIFYKAAFYDRSAHMDLRRRFSIQENYDDFKGDDYRNTHIQFRVIDREKSVFACEPEINPPRSDGWEAADLIDRKQKNTCNLWLAKHFPNWQDITAYWD